MKKPPLSIFLVAYCLCISACGRQPATSDSSIEMGGPDLFVFQDGKGHDGGAVVLKVTVTTAGASNLVPGVKKGYPAGLSPIICYLGLTIENSGTVHASGISLPTIDIESVGGGTEKIQAQSLSVPYFNGVVLAGKSETVQFQCMPIPWTTHIPFACDEKVRVSTNLQIWGGSKVPILSEQLFFRCPM
jgi:hypothetical protein